MIVISVFILLLVVSIIGILYARFVDYPKTSYSSYYGYFYYRATALNIVPWILNIIALIVIAASVLVVFASRTNNDRRYIEYLETREGYAILLKSEDYQFKDSLYARIQKFNREVKADQKAQHSLNGWIVYSDNYDWNDVELIELE